MVSLCVIVKYRPQSCKISLHLIHCSRFDVMPLMSAHCFASPLATSLGVPSQATALLSRAPGPRSLGAPWEGEEHSCRGGGLVQLGCSRWPPRSAWQPWRRCGCAGGPSAVPEARRDGKQTWLAWSCIFSAGSGPRAGVSHCRLTGGYSPLVLVTRKQSL